MARAKYIRELLNKAKTPSEELQDELEPIPATKTRRHKMLAARKLQLQRKTRPYGKLPYSLRRTQHR